MQLTRDLKGQQTPESNVKNVTDVLSASTVGFINQLEACLQPPMDALQARVVALRILVSRIGEQDICRWWASKVWSNGSLVFAPVFLETWPRQRLLIALSAARAAEDSALAGNASSKCVSLFRLDPLYDAQLDHMLAMLDDGTCLKLDAAVDTFFRARTAKLADLALLSTIGDEKNSRLCHHVDALTMQLSELHPEGDWQPSVIPR